MIPPPPLLPLKLLLLYSIYLLHLLTFMIVITIYMYNYHVDSVATVGEEEVSDVVVVGRVDCCFDS